LDPGQIPDIISEISGSDAMKAFLAGTVVAVLIAVAAGLVLQTMKEPAVTAFTTPSARVSTN
jgi:hypothetical protein